jgi:exodeoxyribonuclease VII large subunit
MAHAYLTVDYKEKDAAKALGAKWDSSQRQWYVPEGRELAPFAHWLPDGVADSTPVVTRQLTPVHSSGIDVALPAKKGVSLSSLLAGVSQAVASAYRAGVWVLVEVVELRTNGGHVYMGVSERDSSGSVLAKASAVIWQSTANTILPEFERATGAQLAPGIKLLVRARPVFKPLYGFTIEVDAIDPEYTLGDLEARKREIRERLQAEGVFAANKRLPPPWDFMAVLVVAPEGGAGLGDFQAEANRLEYFGICRFVYAYSRFQGEGAAREICDALQGAMAQWGGEVGGQPDAVVIIRGGGAVNDLAWLNDYDLARYICDLPVPVLTGIGHERDSTVLDEVSNTKFDTPSKVVAGIEQTISKRTTESKTFFEQVANRATRAVQLAKTNATALDAAVRAEAIRHLSQGKQASAALINGIRVDALGEVRSASEWASDAFQQVKTEAQVQVQQAKQMVPALWQQISLDAGRSLRMASAESEVLLGTVLGEAGRDVTNARSRAEDAHASVGASAKQIVRAASVGSEALMREIAGQGPEKTLSRGFALVRDQAGEPLTRAMQTSSGSAIEIQFSDGKVSATTGKQI